MAITQSFTGSWQREVQLGDSEYYIALSNDLKITEARGKEGQVGYNFLPRNKNDSSGIWGFIQ